MLCMYVICILTNGTAFKQDTNYKCGLRYLLTLLTPLPDVCLHSNRCTYTYLNYLRRTLARSILIGLLVVVLHGLGKGIR